MKFDELTKFHRQRGWIIEKKNRPNGVTQDKVYDNNYKHILTFKFRRGKLIK